MRIVVIIVFPEEINEEAPKSLFNIGASATDGRSLTTDTQTICVMSRPESTPYRSLRVQENCAFLPISMAIRTSDGEITRIDPSHT